MKVLFALDPWIYRESAGNQMYTLENIFIKAIKGLKSGKNDVRLLLGEDMQYALKQKKLNIPCKIIVIPLKNLYEIYKNHYEAHKVQFNEKETFDQKKRTAKLIRKHVGKWEPEVVISFTTPASIWKYIYKDALGLQFENGIFSRAPYLHMGQLDPFGFLKKAYPAHFLDKLRDSEISYEQKERIIKFRKVILQEIFEKKNPLKRKDLSKKKYKKILLVPLSYQGVVINDEASEFKSQLDYLLHIMDKVPKTILVLATRHSLQLNGSIPSETEEFLQEKYPNLSFCESFNHYAFLSQWLTPLVDGVITINSTIGYHAALFNKKVFTLGNCEINSIATSNNLDNIEEELEKDIEDNRLNILYHLFTRHSFPLKWFWDGKWLINRLRQMLVEYKKGSSEYNWNSLPLIDSNEDKIFEVMISESPGIKDKFVPRVYPRRRKK